MKIISFLPDMTTYILIFLIGCALGAMVALFVQIQKNTTEKLEAERIRVELSTLQKQRAEETTRYNQLNDEHRKLSAEHTSTYAELESCRTALEKEQKQRHAMLEANERIFHKLNSSREKLDEAERNYQILAQL